MGPACLVAHLMLAHLSDLIAFVDKLDDIFKTLYLNLGQALNKDIDILVVTSNLKIFFLGVKKIIHSLIVDLQVRDVHLYLLLDYSLWDEGVESSLRSILRSVSFFRSFRKLLCHIFNLLCLSKDLYSSQWNHS